MIRLPRTGALLAAVLATSCGSARLALPTGPGAAAADAVPAFEQATKVCRAIRSLSAEIGVSGRANGQRLRGRVLAGLAAPSFALLDAAAPFGASIFIYAARDGEATLLLPRDERVLRHDDPAAVLEAVTGVPLGGAELRRTLTGCPPEEAPGDGLAFGSNWRTVTMSSGRAYLRRASGSAPWQLVSVTQGAGTTAWRAEFSEFTAGLPAVVQLVSSDEGRQFRLRLALSQVEVNPELGDEVFTIRVPDGVEPITLEELRRNGPLGYPR
jgi:hypothetical protein